MSTTTRTGGTRVATTTTAKGDPLGGHLVVPQTPRVINSPTISSGELLALARARTLNSTARDASETQATVGGNNSLVPIVFGQRRVGGRIAAIAIYDHLYVAVVWCMGEVDSVVSVTINDEDLPSGVTATHYTGTAGQTTDSTLASKISGFADAMTGICYSVFNIRPGKTSGFPRFAAIIKGIKVPLTSGGAATWTDNGAYLLAAMIENATWGMGESVDWATVATVAAANDALVSGEKKRILNIVLDSSQPAATWLQSVADYAGCWVIPEGAGYRLVADAAASSVKSFTSANIVEGSLWLATRSIVNRPTMLEVSYTDTAYKPYRESRYASTPTTPRVLSRIARPGITRYSEAKRYATERLNESTVNDKTITFRTFDDALAVQIGDVIDVTHPIGLSAATYRVQRRTPVEYGRWEIEATRYDAGKFDSSLVSGPTTPDTSVLGPEGGLFGPPSVTALSLTEDVYQTADGLWSSRLQATWTAPAAFPYVVGYKVTFYKATAPAFKVGEYFVTDVYAVSPPIKEGYTYTCLVQTQSTNGALSIGFVGVVSVVGRVGTAPPAVASIAADVTMPGTAVITWPASSATDVKGYEIRVGGTDWASATPLDIVAHPVVRYEASGLAAGSTVFRIKARDSIRSATYPNGQESASEVTTTATVKALSELATLGGNLLFSGASVRIKADWSNATYSTRAALQTSTTNGATSVGILPNGTSTSSVLNAFNASDPTNSCVAQIGVSASTVYVGAAITGSGTQLPLGFYVGGTLYGEFQATGTWRWKFSSKSGVPTTSDIASGYCGVWKDTGSGTVYLVINDGGTIKKVALS